MATTAFSEKEIEITSVYFNNNRTDVRFQSYPRRITFKGREYSLVEN